MKHVDETAANQISHSAKGGMSRRVFKLMGLFSGMQVFNILCSIIKNKLVALWLQASGLGLFGIYSSSMETIATLTDLGLRQSAVRDVAISADSPSLLSRTVAVVRTWAKFAGVIGALAISFLSPLLGKLLFGDINYCWGFVVLSVSMFLNSLINGESAILQGTHRLKVLAKSTLIGNSAGLLLSIPMFYWLGENSVILSFIVYSIANIIALLYVRVKPGVKDDYTLPDKLKAGKSMAKMGISLAGAAFITNLANLALLTWLNRTASTTEVGLFQAGNMLVGKYIGLVLAAVAVEYYPRLCSVAHSRQRTSLFVNHETILLLSVITPMMLLFLIFRYLIVNILYTDEFEVIIPFLSLAVLSTPFKAVAYCGAYSVLARGDAGIYIITETVDSLIGLALNMLFYSMWGLMGIGVAFILWNLGYALIIGTVYIFRYKMKYNSGTLVVFFLSVLSGIFSWYSCNYLTEWVSYILISVITLCWFPIIRNLYR